MTPLFLLTIFKQKYFLFFLLKITKDLITKTVNTKLLLKFKTNKNLIFNNNKNLKFKNKY